VSRMNKKPTKPDTTGARIRVLRIARGLSQAELAKMCGVTQAAISQIELNLTRGLKGDTLLLLLKVLDTNSNYLLQGRNSPGGVGATEPVTLDERELLAHYRSLDDAMRRTIMRMVRAAVIDPKPSAADPFPALTPTSRKHSQHK
jgi:transcriptional regulator with XRE-family HTH domain